MACHALTLCFCLLQLCIAQQQVAAPIKLFDTNAVAGSIHYKAAERLK